MLSVLVDLKILYLLDIPKIVQHVRGCSQIMSAAEGGGEVWKMLTMNDKGGRGLRKMLTLADKGGWESG